MKQFLEEETETDEGTITIGFTSNKYVESKHCCSNCKHIRSEAIRVIKNSCKSNPKITFNPISYQVELLDCESKNQFNNCSEYKESFNLFKWIKRLLVKKSCLNS